jgi:enoyl-CoA hydratase/carnithine racemase
MSGIRFELNNKIATINLNKASTKNSLDRNDLKKITEFLKKIKNMNLICLIISSSGDTFSSGMNFKDLSIGDWSKNPISEVCDLIEKIPFISICKINGAVYGGSVELAISTDFRIGSTNCKIHIPASKFGIHYGYKGIKRCLDFFGLQITKRLLLLGDEFNFEELKVIKFFDFYYDSPRNMDTILKSKINQLSQLSPDSIKKMKESINDCKNNEINVKIETERFQSGFESGLILEKIKKLRTK